MPRLLELFSGTGSIGAVAKKKGYEVISVDRDMGCEGSDRHYKEDIFNWDYQQYPVGYFDLITASPVCLWWSNLRKTWIGRASKTIKPQGGIVNMDDLELDIEIYGKPMVDKTREIIDYFKPSKYWIENPQTGAMKKYITDLPFYDVDYCKYGLPYRKRTRFWTNIEGFIPKKCRWDCESVIEVGEVGNIRRTHKKQIGCFSAEKKIREWQKNNNIEETGGQTTRLDRYRIPHKLVDELISLC